MANQVLKAQKKYQGNGHNPQEGQPAHQVLGSPVHQGKENKPEEQPQGLTGTSSRQHTGCHENAVRHQQAPQPAWIGMANFNSEYDKE